MRWFVVVAAVLAVCACGKKAPEVSALARTKAHGGMNAATWTDANGENLVVFTMTDAELPPAHPDDPEAGPAGFERHVRVELTAASKRLQSFTDDDSNDTFGFNGGHGFVDEALGLTDLDHDGVGELTFAYALDSATGLQPVTLVLVVLEGRERFLLRGTTFCDYGDGTNEGGDFVPDAAMAKSPFFAHARAVWARIRGLHACA